MSDEKNAGKHSHRIKGFGLISTKGRAARRMKFFASSALVLILVLGALPLTVFGETLTSVSGSASAEQEQQASNAEQTTPETTADTFINSAPDIATTEDTTTDSGDATSSSSEELSALDADVYLSITPMTKLTGTPTPITEWDYVVDYTYDLYFTITLGSSGTGRTILFTAPEGFRFVIPSALPSGISAMSYPEGSSHGKTVLVALADSAGEASMTSSLSVIQAGSGTVPNQASTLGLIGAHVQEAAEAGASPTYTATAVYSEGDVPLETESATLSLKTYKDDTIFDWFRYKFNYTGVNNKNFTTLTMDPYGFIGAPGPNGRVIEWDHSFVLENTTVHEPYWNLSVKVYLPEGFTSGNAALSVQNAGDGRGDYVVLDSALATLGTSVGNYRSANMLSPLVDTASVSVTNTVLSARLMLQLEEGESPQSGHLYEASPVVVTYTTASGEHTQTLSGLRVQCNTFTNTDTYSLALPANTLLDFPQGFEGNTADAAKTINLTAPASFNNLGTMLNNRHVGGTLSFEMGEGYEVYGMSVAWNSQNNTRYLPQVSCAFPADAVVTYYIGGTAYTDTTRTGDSFSFPEATPGNRVERVVFSFPTGFELITNSYSFGFDLRAGEGLPDNVPLAGSPGSFEPGLHRTSLKVTLADDSCAAFNGTAAGGSFDPRIVNGAHTKTFNVDLRAAQDLLLLQTYGDDLIVGSSPFLSGSGTQADRPLAYLAFGYNTFNGTAYVNRSGSWMTYHDVAINFSGEETLSMMNGVIGLVDSLLYTNLRFAYTTNTHPEVRTTTPVQSGDPEGAALSGGSAQSVNLGLDVAGEEYLTSLTLCADAFKVVKVHYLIGNGLWGRDGGLGRITFQSRTSRTLPCNPEVALPNRSAGDEGFGFDATMTASDSGVDQRTSTLYNHQGEPVDVTFRLFMSAPLYAQGGAYTQPREVSAGTQAQGTTFTVSVARGVPGSNLKLLNTELWLRLDDHFSFVDFVAPAEVDYEVKEYEGNTYVIIREDPEHNHTGTSTTAQTYQIKVRALPSTPVGPYAVFDAGWYNITDTLDPVKQAALAPYLYGILASTSTVNVDAPSNHEGRDLNGNGMDDSEETLIKMVTAVTTISPRIVTGVTLIAGRGSQLVEESTENIQHFNESEAAELTLYAALGGAADEALPNYETILTVPIEGASEELVYGDGSETATPDFALALRGPASLDTDGLNEQITYSTSANEDTWLNESEVEELAGGWSEVRRVRIFVPTMPAGITVGAWLALDASGSDGAPAFNNAVGEGSRSYVAGSYSYGENADAQVSGYSNLASFEAHLYSLDGGFVFQDRDNSNDFSAGDVRWSGVTVELWSTDETGTMLKIATTLTDEQGIYHFEECYLGSYAIKVVAPAPESAYRFCEAASQDSADDVADATLASHVDQNGWGTAINLEGSMTSAQNAGIQVSYYALTVEYRLASGTPSTLASGTLIGSSSREVQDGPVEDASIAPSFNESGYHLAQGEDVAKQYSTSFLSPEATVVFLVEPDTYSVTYAPGEHGSFGTQTTDRLLAGTATPQAPAATAQEGWLFSGWSPTPSDTVSATVVYTALWQEIVPVVELEEDPTEPIIATTDIETTEDPEDSEQPVQRAAETVNEETEVSADEPAFTFLGNTQIPLFSATPGQAWALINLVLAFVGVLLALIALVRRSRKDLSSKKEQAGNTTTIGSALAHAQTSNQTSGQKDNYRKERHVRLPLLVITVAFAVVGIIFFLITEDMSRPMVLMDYWTIVNALILLAEIIVFAFVFTRKKEEIQKEEIQKAERPEGQVA